MQHANIVLNDSVYSVPVLIKNDAIFIRKMDLPSTIRYKHHVLNYLNLYPNVAIVNEYNCNRVTKNNYVTKNKTAKSLQDLCLNKIAVSLKKPFRKIKFLHAAQLMRDTILSLKLPFVFNPILLQKKIPLHCRVGYVQKSKLERLDKCIRGHAVTEEQQKQDYLIDFFCTVCALDVFKIK
ncbi:hypothetical protein [Thysanoplusia orichalcea nucleopolyhedrovirus]|uniref:Uncharacterized protein n=1 Tax=Thysanoplusia orichalcea nucleopolyhedrovirus TaxID=101850 RepID=L0CLC5_9ABAC|nr:hypothetical protein [Thysanoplusia orichalcea nucleopolyhedrovirus]AGA16235.1 hypothetical protein [Thysanoplusia orichalcea nucleopolyhedrovirus]